MVLRRLKEQVCRNNSNHLSLNPPWELLSLPPEEGQEVGATTSTHLFGSRKHCCAAPCQVRA